MENEKASKRSGFFAKYAALSVTAKILTPLVILLCTVLLFLGISGKFTTEAEITKLGFKDIGELATQVAYCTEVSVNEGGRQIFGIDIPFTKNKFIFSYNVEVKAGYNFEEIQCEVNNKTKEITVSMPKAKILSCEIDLDSLKIYHEDESMFKEFTIKDNNDAMKEIKANAESNAVANGLLDNARINAETLLKGFISNMYNKENGYKEPVFTDI